MLSHRYGGQDTSHNEYASAYEDRCHPVALYPRALIAKGPLEYAPLGALHFIYPRVHTIGMNEKTLVMWKRVPCDNCGELAGLSTAKVPTGVLCLRCACELNIKVGDKL